TESLIHGIDPYTVVARDPLGGAYNFGYTTTIYPYLPLNLILSVPGVALLGDYRYSLAASNLLTLLFLRAAAKKRRVDPRWTDALSLAFVLFPRSVLITGMGWKEPFMGAALAGFVYFNARAPGGPAESTAFMMLPALKQYMALPVLLYASMRPRLRSVAIGI